MLYLFRGDFMTKKQVDQILLKIAKEENVTIDTVRREILLAMEEAQKSTDPQVQARWASIPKKGTTITIEEFLDYTCNRIRSFPF